MTATDDMYSPLVEPRVIHISTSRRRLSRRWLTPIGLLALGSIVFLVRLTIEDWRGIEPLVHAPRPPRRPVVLNEVPRLAPRVPPVPEPAPSLIRPDARALRPVTVAGYPPRERLRPSEPVALPDHADIAADLAVREIYDEADRLRAEQAKLAQLLVHQPEMEQQRQVSARLNRIQEAISAAEAERPVFHAEMVSILKEHGPRAGGPLMALLARQNSTPLREVSDAVAVVMKGRKAPSLTAKKVMLYRSLGMPEPLILHKLMQAECRKITARHGPRNRSQAMVRAAEQLRAVPLRPRQIDSPPPGQGQLASPQ